MTMTLQRPIKRCRKIQKYPPTEFKDEEWMKVRDDLWHLGKKERENRGHPLYWVYHVSLLSRFRIA